MSYILDALRKADAERRGVDAPGALGEPAVLVDTDDADGEGDAPPSRPWGWVLGGVAIALAGAAGWFVLRGGSEAPAPLVAAAPAAPADAPAPVAAPDAAPRQSPAAGPDGTVAGDAPPAPPPPANDDALPRFPPPLPEPAPAPPPAPAPVAAALPAPRGAPPPGIALVPPPPAPAAAADRVITVSELPEAARRDFPKLSVGGAMYSERAADRMVVLNGQVFHEGDALGRDLRLRQIRLKSAVVEFRGHRVEIAY